MNTRSSALSAICSWPPVDLTSEESGQSPWIVWANAVGVMARGDYRVAFAALERLGACDEPEVAGLASATIASGYRQLGIHARAVAHDERAISSGGVAVLDGLIGRAADGIGMGAADLCADHLVMARDLLTEFPEQHHRGSVRIAWVEAELALLLDNPAVGSATEAVEGAELLRSPRHLLKSQLIQGVAWQVVGDPRGQIQLIEVLRTAHSLGITTLVWPAALALGSELPVGLDVMALAARSFIAEHLPQDAGETWLRATSPLTQERGSPTPQG